MSKAILIFFSFENKIKNRKYDGYCSYYKGSDQNKFKHIVKYDETYDGNDDANDKFFHDG